MTTAQILDYYADLLIVQYRGKPKARAHVKAIVKGFLMDQLATQVRDAYDLDTAVGKQLDVLAKYAGLLGYDGSTNARKQRNFLGPITITDDDELRQLIKFKIAKNYSGSSLSDVQDIIQLFFPGTIQVFDHKNMTMGYYFDASFGTQELAEVVIRAKLLPKPMGVQLNAVVYAAEVLTTGFFGFRHEQHDLDLGVGFKRYGDDPTGRWLSRWEIIQTP